MGSLSLVSNLYCSALNSTDLFRLPTHPRSLSRDEPPIVANDFWLRIDGLMSLHCRHQMTRSARFAAKHASSAPLSERLEAEAVRDIYRICLDVVILEPKLIGWTVNSVFCVLNTQITFLSNVIISTNTE